MIHTIVIRPSRVDLVLKTYSADYNKLTEKKLVSKEFSFRFNREIIDTGAYYKSFYSILADILQPYKKDIKQLQVSLRSSFFQLRSIYCEESMYQDNDYINWEVNKTINDVSEHFKYGTFFEENIKTLQLFIIRKSVESYFDEILKKIISYDVNFSVGYDFVTESKENVFVSTNKEVDKPFDIDQSSIRMWNLPTEKIRSEVRFKRTLISTIVVFVLMAAFYLTYFQSENMYKLYSKFFEQNDSKPTPDKIIIDAKPEVALDTTKVDTTSSEEKFLAKLFEEDDKKVTIVQEIKEEPKKAVVRSINIHDALDSLMSFSPRSLIFEDNIALIQLSDAGSSKYIISFANRYKLSVIDKKKDYISLRVGDGKTQYLPAGKSDHNRIFKQLKLDTKKTYSKIKVKQFYSLTDLLLKKDIIYKKFVISDRGNQLFITVYFD